MKECSKVALVTGIYGQDGSYAAELLHAKGYTVHGISRERHGKQYEQSIDLFATVHFGDITDESFVDTIFEKIKFDEIYNFAAISDLGTAKKFPELTQSINHHAVGFLFTKAYQLNPDVRMFQASSAQMFDTSVSPQNEHTPFLARNGYAEAKIAAHQDFVVGLRSQGAFVCSGYLFNHESPRREERFVTGKISRTLSKIKLGLIDTPLELGNMDMERDWSFAGDCVEAAYMILQAKKPKDYIIASGVLHTVREFVENTCESLGISITWQGVGIDELGVDESGKTIVKVNPDFYAPKEDFTMVGDISNIKRDLGWEPKVAFQDLVRMMVESNFSELAP